GHTSHEATREHLASGLLHGLSIYVMSRKRESFHGARSVCGLDPFEVIPPLHVGSSENVTERPETDTQPPADRDLAIESVAGSDHVAQRAERDAAPSRKMEDGQRVICSEQQTIMKLWIMAQLEQHS